MLIYAYLLCFLSFQYLADATFTSVTYVKIQQAVTMVLFNVTAVNVTSRLECAFECFSRKSFCFSYDNSLLECGIGNCLTPNTYIGVTQEFFTSCNSNEGFKLFTSGSITACLWVSTKISSFVTARNDCKARSSHLYTVKTFDKLKILRENIPPSSWYWIGLNDIKVENEFRWEDDNTICDSACRTQLFASGQPNDYNNQDCVFYRLNLVEDYHCNNELLYLCEK